MSKLLGHGIEEFDPLIRALDQNVLDLYSAVWPYILQGCHGQEKVREKPNFFKGRELYSLTYHLFL